MYVGIEHAQHLRQILKSKYTFTKDWEGKHFLGMQLDWDYEKQTVDASMPDYVAKALQRFQRPPPNRPEHSPHAYIEPTYGATIQYTPPEDTSTPLTKVETQTLQEITWNATILCKGHRQHHAGCTRNTGSCPVRHAQNSSTTLLHIQMPWSDSKPAT
jgi:hypothetical protein